LLHHTGYRAPAGCRFPSVHQCSPVETPIATIETFF
jgi:hypothetical protein